ncbi:MAG: peptidase T [Acidobacteria bacterium]|nr:peptidase T [Acidobacteriota bacterium]
MSRGYKNDGWTTGEPPLGRCYPTDRRLEATWPAHHNIVSTEPRQRAVCAIVLSCSPDVPRGCDVPDRETLLDRFVRYARIDTQSSETSTTYPSTDTQKDLLRVLVADLVDAGLTDAAMDEHGYVMATLPSNIPLGHAAHGKVATVGLIAHVDTYHEVSGRDVKPQVHRNYDGGDLVLPGDPSVVIRAADEPALVACTGMTIITADGTTLLGADDKAGVAEILEVLWRLKGEPARLHGPIRIGFTPDEEVGRGTEHFNVQAFAADVAYTIDGSGCGELEDETFCADSAHVTVRGADVHPGYAKGKMVNAVRVMADLVMALPQNRTPETTEKREGYLHPISVSGNTSEAKAHLLVRDFTEDGLQHLETILRDVAAWLERKYRGAAIAIEIKPSYRNMRYALAAHQHVVDCAEEAIRRAGLTPTKSYVRGGTDGARLSFMGLPTPNLFDGSMNFHGKKEWIPLEWMEKSVETVLHLLDVWVEQAVARV